MGAGAALADPQSGLDNGNTTVFHGSIPLLLVVSVPSVLGRFFLTFELVLLAVMLLLLSDIPLEYSIVLFFFFFLLLLDRPVSVTLPPRKLAPCWSLLFFLVLLLAATFIEFSLVSCCCFFSFIFFCPISFARFPGNDVLGLFVALRFGGLVSSVLGALEVSDLEVCGKLSRLFVSFDIIPLMLFCLTLLLDIGRDEMGLEVAASDGECTGVTVELLSTVGVVEGGFTGAMLELLCTVGAAEITVLLFVDFLGAFVELLLSFLFLLSSGLSMPSTSPSG